MLSSGDFIRLPTGTFNRSYEGEMAVIRTRLQWVLFGLLLVLVFFVIPRFAGERWVSFFNLAGITIVAVTGVNILTGYTGLLTLGQSAFVCVGAYTTGILATTYGLPPLVILPCAIVMTALIGLIFGATSLRVKGFYLALATLAAQFIIPYLIMRFPSVTQGARGILLPVAQIGEIKLSSPSSFYYLVMGSVMLVTFFAKNLARSKIGRAFIAIRDNDLAAECLGVNIFYYKMLSFAICSAFAGWAGFLWAYNMRMIMPDQFLLMDSIWYLGMIIVGGMGSALGPIFGVLFIRIIDEGASALVPTIASIAPGLEAIGATFGQIVFGVVIILFLLFEPRGLSHRWQTFKAWYRLHPLPY